MTQTCKLLQPVVSQIFFNPSSFWIIIWFWQQVYVQDLSIFKSSTMRLLWDWRLTFVRYCLSFPLLAGTLLLHPVQPPRTLPSCGTSNQLLPTTFTRWPSWIPLIDSALFAWCLYTRFWKLFTFCPCSPLFSAFSPSISKTNGCPSSHTLGTLPLLHCPPFIFGSQF